MRRTGKACVAAVALLAVCAGCGSSGGAGKAASQPRTSATAAQGSALTVVAIGDSDATGIGDPTTRGWVGRYGDLLQARLGRPVAVENGAIEGQTSAQLRDAVAHDQKLRHELAGADVVLIGIGGADLNAGDSALQAGTCQGKRCYTKILKQFGANFSAIAAEVRRVAPQALLRAMSLPNGFPGAGSALPPFITESISRYQAMSERASVCHAMQADGGRCVDVLTAFNGPRGAGNAYATGLITKNPCCYPSAKGQQLIAQLLIRTGVGGLAPAS